MPNNDHLVLLIEDEQPIRRFLRASLIAEGYRVAEATTGEEGLKIALREPPDFVILDLGLPDMDGHDVLQRLREWLSAPILILSARNQEKQKITALDAGVDNYLTKPFGMGELFARLRLALRHTQARQIDSTVLQIGDLRVDLAAHIVTRGDQTVRITPLEYKLLVLLVRNAGKVMTHRQLLRDVWATAMCMRTTICVCLWPPCDEKSNRTRFNRNIS